jgi:cytochrome c-type biogenesis protein CcmH
MVAQLGWAAPLVAQGAVESIASELICLCGCTKLLNVCDMDTAAQMKSVISEKLAAGWDKRQVIDYMTETYGEHVLAAPPKSGFNLTAWLTPFGALLAGSVVIWLVVGAWVRHRRQFREVEIETAAADDLEAKYGALLEKELGEFEA